MTALDLNSSQQLLNDEKMTTFIRYRTPYLINNHDPLFIYLFIYFALGNDVSFHCVIGLPTLLYLSALIGLVKEPFVLNLIVPFL